MSALRIEVSPFKFVFASIRLVTYSFGGGDPLLRRNSKHL